MLIQEISKYLPINDLEVFNVCARPPKSGDLLTDKPVGNTLIVSLSRIVVLLFLPRRERIFTSF